MAAAVAPELDVAQPAPTRKPSKLALRRGLTDQGTGQLRAHGPVQFEDESQRAGRPFQRVALVFTLRVKTRATALYTLKTKPMRSKD